MLSVARIHRSLTHDAVAAEPRPGRDGTLGRAVRELAADGLPLPPSLRGAAASPQAVQALLLRRAVELTFGPDPAVVGLTGDLLAGQRDDGRWGTEGASAAIATAAAVAALGRVGRDTTRTAGGITATGLERAAAAGLAWLERWARATLAAGPTEAGLVVMAFVAYLLADDATARRHPLAGTLHRTLRSRGELLPPPARRLWDTVRWTAEALAVVPPPRA